MITPVPPKGHHHFLLHVTESQLHKKFASITAILQEIQLLSALSFRFSLCLVEDITLSLPPENGGTLFLDFLKSSGTFTKLKFQGAVWRNQVPRE